MKHKRVEYEPPSDQSLFEFAREVGDRLAAQAQPSYAHPDVVRGLADFLATIATIEANQRNRAQLFDEREDTGYAEGA